MARRLPAQFVRDTEEGYKLQTAQEKNWQQERGGFQPKPKDRREILRELLDEIFSEPSQLRYHLPQHTTLLLYISYKISEDNWLQMQTCQQLAAGATLEGMDIETRTLEDVLGDLDGGLRDLYGRRYRGLVLYGSHARGEADEGSDVDLLLLLEKPVQVGKEIRRSSGLVASLALQAGLVLSLVPVSVEDYRASSDPYLINARTEGAIVSPAAG